MFHLTAYFNVMFYIFYIFNYNLGYLLPLIFSIGITGSYIMYDLRDHIVKKYNLDLIKVFGLNFILHILPIIVLVKSNFDIYFDTYKKNKLFLLLFTVSLFILYCYSHIAYLCTLYPNCNIIYCVIYFIILFILYLFV